MKKLLILFLLGSSLAYGQRNFTIEETVLGPRQFAAQNFARTQWVPSADAFTHLDSKFQNLQVREATNNWQPKNILSANELTEALKIAIGQAAKLSNFPVDYHWVDSTTLSFSYQTLEKLYLLQYDLRTKKANILAETPAAGRNVERSNDYSKAAYLMGNNIEIIDAAGNVTQVTNDTVDGIVNGSDYTHRQEFGINKGMWWSPDNEQLLYYRKDESMVSNYPLVQWSDRVATVKNIRYPMAGMKSEEVSLVVYNTRSQRKTTLKTEGPKEQYLTLCTWDPSGKFVYVGILNREQNHLKLNQYDAASGVLVKTLFEEQSSSWVEPLHALTFVPTTNDQFLYQTDKDGYNQLYLYNTAGKLIRRLGDKDVIVESLGDFSADGKKISYTGITHNGLDRHLFQVDIHSGKTQQLTSESGTHAASLSYNGKYLYDQYSSITTVNDISIREIRSNRRTALLEAANPFEGKIDLPKIEAVALISADGKTPLNGRIIYPPDFDATKQYPVLYYLYGGSHAQLVQNKWLYGAGYFDLYMAQQGYVVFTMDNRGSDARGRDFTRVTHRQLGKAEMADQLQGIAYLESKPFVDSKHMGIFGWSFGGFMTTSFMVQQPDIFHTGVAGGPVIDWKFYEVMYGERYMDSPQENPEGYASTSLLDKADQLKGNLMIIHGAQDPVVVQQHSMEFIQACIKAGKQVDYFLYPTHEHNVLGKDRIHLYEKIANYFDMHLKK
ncbi:S9 family peptidase [Sphingobacterium paludis]|uniref:Dipeptidyl-peptidase-4 n=1 Tax=Sphingobacterium paludis TaxID=1476465 RepID=A0A4R7CW26_9SPHI|nr:DPP IV N-terminal domain-containing protein [Sphingobacterium paludis]TDS12420.1 dipeptidyl-peptidase-4 [Sphingobacterium paludis]